MPRRWICYVAMAGIACAGAACSSSRANRANRPSAAPEAAASRDASSPAAADKVLYAVIDSAAFSQDSDGARIVLNSESPLLYTSYEPRPDTLVIDLTGARPSDGFVAPSPEGALVKTIKVEPQVELGKTQTRLTIVHDPKVKYEIASQGKSLAIAFDSEEAGAAAVAEAPESPRPAVVTAVDLPEAKPEAAPEAASATAVPPAPTVPTAVNVPVGEIARTLESIEVHAAGDSVVVTLLGDGVLSASDFVLPNPPRIVLDFNGVLTRVKRRTIAGTGPVLRARVAQFKTSPERVTRVVLDLSGTVPYSTERDGERLRIRVGTGALAHAAPPEPASPGGPSRTVLSAAASSEPVDAGSPPPPPAPVSTAEKPAPEMPKAEDQAAAVPAETSAAPSAPAPPAVNPMTRVATGPGVESIPPQKRARGVLEAKRNPRPAPPKVEAGKAAPRAVKKKEDVLFESAEALLVQQEKPTDRQELNNAYKSKTVGGGESQYTGEPISLDLKDADIKDVFRTISELTGLNIVIDPDVRGTVTVRLENVPWDQALELILKQNGLGYIIENNVMRIATIGKLQNEERERAALDLARQTSLPTKTVTKKLSYAKAGATAATVKRVMSPRGDIIVDERTNTLIIREIADFMPTVLQLIDSLDTPTPQVIIESRIVETTKTFGRSLGVNWGFTGVADAAHGNTTNLVFPNNGTLGGTVFQRPDGTAQPPNTGLALRLGNVLDTFNLDIALTAAENEGLVKIVSSPRVAAMTNTRASIQTGLQIPVQTSVNNTTSVQYVDATLQLSVTPQITAEGTVLMDVNITKRQPAPGVAIQGAGNVPLSIRQAQTQIIVKDGGTAVIGGIFQMSDNDSYQNVPGLWKIPVIGRLFRNKITSDNHDELIIFITPRIVH
ncbi:MAG: type IV pilus secretin PilQ [Thermoanaerobaculia bacterium]